MMVSENWLMIMVNNDSGNSRDVSSQGYRYPWVPTNECLDEKRIHNLTKNRHVQRIGFGQTVKLYKFDVTMIHQVIITQFSLITKS